jgi:hypothetical protein
MYEKAIYVRRLSLTCRQNSMIIFTHARDGGVRRKLVDNIDLPP